MDTSLDNRDFELESRILAVMPLDMNQWDRGRLLYRLGMIGGARAESYLTNVVGGTIEASAHERAAALQALELLGSGNVSIFEQALHDRDLSVQLIGLGALSSLDSAGAAVPTVTKWLSRRLKGRAGRRVWDFNELPLALGYFASVGQLVEVASLIEKNDNQILSVERLVLERMWPRLERQKWIAGDLGARRPNLAGLGPRGFPSEFYLMVEAEIDGSSLSLPSPPSDEEEAAAGDIFEAEFFSILERLERKLGR